MAAEENHNAPAAVAVFNEEDDDSSEEEEADDEEDPLTLTAKPRPLPRSPPPPPLPQQQPPPSLQNDDVFDEDEELEEEEEEEDAAVGLVTVAISGDNPSAAASVSAAALDPKRHRALAPSPSVPGERKQQPSSAPLDESRKLFQRLWTDEDEIELLQGFLEYTSQRGTAQHHHHDTALFYDQIRGKLQLDFNKNQLVEKLRRLKKKYRNVVNRISSGKDFAFKSPHDQAAFEISRKIWSNAGRVAGEDNAFEEDDANPSPNPNPISTCNYLNNDGGDGVVNSSEKKASRPRKRSRAKSPEKPAVSNNAQLGNSIPNLVEETVKSCLSPLFKELLQSAMNGPCGIRGLAALNPLPLGFGAPSMLNLSGADMADERWRKQQILELEVYSKRLDLVQDQIKSVLEELRSMKS